jgi:hypothetical protein
MVGMSVIIPNRPIDRRNNLKRCKYPSTSSSCITNVKQIVAPIAVVGTISRGPHATHPYGAYHAERIATWATNPEVSSRKLNRFRALRRIFARQSRGITSAATAPSNQYGTRPPFGDSKIPIADSTLSLNPGVLKTGSIWGAFFQVSNFQTLKLRRQTIPKSIDA